MCGVGGMGVCVWRPPVGAGTERPRDTARQRTTQSPGPSEKRDGMLKLSNLSEFREGMVYKGGQGIAKSHKTAQNLWPSNKGRLPLQGLSSDLCFSSSLQNRTDIPRFFFFLCLIFRQYSLSVKHYRKSKGKKAS